MVFIACRRCRKMVSSKAPVCPHCGGPVGLLNRLREYRDAPSGVEDSADRDPVADEPPEPG